MIKISHISAGFIAVLVGYTSSVAIIFQAAQTLGTSQAQLNSWMLVLGCGMGFSSILLSTLYKIPIITAWSTPGAALLTTSLIGVDIDQAVASFILTGLLIFICGITGWFEKIQYLIPSSIGNAMLAGILFQVCVGILEYIHQDLLLILIMFTSYLIGKAFLKNFTIPVTFAIGVFVCWQQDLFSNADIHLVLAAPVWVTPNFTFASFISISIPLFIVTMTSQNIPGVETLKAAGYKPPVSASLIVTGLTTTILGAMGGFSYNLAAITAAICCTEEVDTNKNTRYFSGIFTGVFYIITGLFGATVVSLFFIAPKALVVSIAGLALLSTLANSLHSALADKKDREAGLITLLVTISGINFLSIGAAFWGLIAGIIFLYFTKLLSKVNFKR